MCMSPFKGRYLEVRLWNLLVVWGLFLTAEKNKDHM